MLFKIQEEKRNPEALRAPVGLSQAIETAAALAPEDGLAQLRRLEKIHLFEAGGKRLRSGREFAGRAGIRPDGRNLLWHMHLHQMARFAAFQHAQGSMVDKPPQRRPHGFFAKPGALGQPRNRH